MSTESTGRTRGDSAGARAGRKVAGEIGLEPGAVGQYAVKIAKIGREIADAAQFLGEPGLVAVINEVPDCYWASRTAVASLAASTEKFYGVAGHTVALAYIFEQLEAVTFGSGIPQRVWESYLAQQSKTDDVDGLLGLLDDTNKVLTTDFGPLSFNDARMAADVIALPGDMAALAGAITTTGVNRGIRRALRDGATSQGKAAARRAVVAALGEDVIGKPGGQRARWVVNEFVEKGAFADIDDLVARVTSRGALPADQLNAIRVGALQSSSRVARSAATVQAALSRPGIAARSLAIERLAALQARGGRIGGAVAPVSSLVARRSNAARFATRGVAPRGALGKVVAKAGVRAVGSTALGVVLLPFDVRAIFTADTNLGRTSAVLGTIATVSGGAAVLTSWTGVGGVGFGTIALVATAGSVAATGADAANQAHQARVYQRAYEKAYKAAAEKAYQDQLDKDFAKDLEEVLEKHEARVARITGVPRQRVPPATVSKQSVFYRFVPTAVAA